MTGTSFAVVALIIGAILIAMNERFVPVKVDREERPDVDGLYMPAA